MINLNDFQRTIAKTPVAPWQTFLLDAVNKRYQNYTHGELSEWESLLANLPKLCATQIELQEEIRIEGASDLDKVVKKELVNQLQKLHPWRKGPFFLFGIEIDTEWRSDWKWERIRHNISSLKNRTVLDVGCGNGYHCLRMLGDGASWVLGIDPSQKYLAQFSLMQKYIKSAQCHGGFVSSKITD